MTHRKSVKRSVSFVAIAFIVFLSLAFALKEKGNFPSPGGIENMLFYVQRSLNRNTIIYQLNVNAKNEVDTLDPITQYWINYEGRDDKEELNTIQRKFAYGLDFSLTDREKKTYCFNFVSYRKQKLYLMRSPIDQKYRVYSIFNNKMMSIKRIYIHIEGGSFWYPKVKYIEVSGKDVKSNLDVIEKIVIDP